VRQVSVLRPSGTFSATSTGAVAYSIPHGLGTIPTFANAVPKNSATAGISFISATTTNIVVNYSVAPSSGASLSWYWQAIK